MNKLSLFYLNSLLSVFILSTIGNEVTFGAGVSMRGLPLLPEQRNEVEWCQ